MTLWAAQGLWQRRKRRAPTFVENLCIGCLAAVVNVLVTLPFDRLSVMYVVMEASLAMRHLLLKRIMLLFDCRSQATRSESRPQQYDPATVTWANIKTGRAS